MPKTPNSTTKVTEADVNVTGKENESEKKVADPSEGKVAHSPPMDPAERVPSNWNIVEAEDGRFDCRNMVTGRVFTGTISEFNKNLKG